MHKWDKLKQLSRQERSWLWQAWLLLPVVKLLLWLVGYQRTLCLLQSLGVQKGFLVQSVADAALQAASLGRLVNIAACYSVLPVNCLPRSLVLWWLLQRAGVASDLRIGVKKQADTLAGHAWVEHGGVPINDKESRRYAAFALSFAHLEKRTL
jgi:hypothetical protein